MKPLHHYLSLALLISLFTFSCNSPVEQPLEVEDQIEEKTDTNITSNFNQPIGINESYEAIWQKPELVLSMLGDLTGKTVADIGAGSGFFTFKLIPHAEKVIAVDIDPRFLTYIDSMNILTTPKQMQGRLETRLASEKSPNLKTEEVDIILIVNTLAYIPNHIDYLKNLKNTMKDKGKILVIDFKKKRLPVGQPAEYKVPLFQVENEFYEAGFTNIKTDDTSLDYQYMIIGEK